VSPPAYLRGHNILPSGTLLQDAFPFSQNTLILDMTVKRTLQETTGIYFITFTCTHWLPLITMVNAHDAVYKWLDILKSKGHHVLGYVIMPNHLHLLIAFGPQTKSINTIIGNGKRFLAYELVQRLQAGGFTDILGQLSQAVNDADRKRGKLYQVFRPSFDAKECRTDAFIWQKLNYIHQNPVSGKWMLAANALDYPHSSAQYYLTGEQGGYEVFNFNLLKDVS
jgi:REP element-mobilizing transposase RayT